MSHGSFLHKIPDTLIRLVEQSPLPVRHTLAKLGIPRATFYRWSKEFLEAGKKRLAGDTARAATSEEVKELRREASALKEVVAELTLENRLLKKSVTADGEDVA